ncbi:MAG: hypothetical protein A2170_10640 [Deltaproteobacteria bacterium RBG_13_53_10]|nr:MAG: hypothetical protein A2170_10640 [Deltaproteobacteria bacterium RBG_13_53_10]
MKGYRHLLDLDIILMVILGAFCTAFLIETYSFNPTAALFPRLVSIISLILILWTITGRCWILVRKTQDVSQPSEEVSARPEGSMVWYISLVTMVSYYLLTYILGFTLVTFIYLLALPPFLGYKKYKIVFITGILWTAGFVYVFKYILYARVPEGLTGIFFRWLTSRL